MSGEPPLAGAELITQALRSGSRDGGPALVAFLTAGFPSRERFRQHLLEIARASDLVEIGVPFSDPMAEGLTIQHSSEVALRAGVSLEWILSELQALARPGTPLLLMSYLNPLLSYGLGALAERAERVGVSGLIVPDLPWEESGPLREALNARGLALVQLVTPVTPAQRLALLARASQGFVYAVTRTGTTGRSVAVQGEMLAYLDRVRAVARLPVCAGFGIRTREQIELLRGHADGAVVGSALVEVLERGESPQRWLERLRAPA